MTTREYTTRSCLGRRVLLLVIVACLSLSSSEGLRLSPFPVFDLEKSAATKAEAHESGSTELTSRYNPTVVPTRSMKRGKQVVHCEKQPFQSSSELSNRPLCVPATPEGINIISLALTSRIPSRAPPFSRNSFDTSQSPDAFLGLASLSWRLVYSSILHQLNRKVSPEPFGS